MGHLGARSSRALPPYLPRSGPKRGCCRSASARPVEMRHYFEPKRPRAAADPARLLCKAMRSRDSSVLGIRAFGESQQCGAGRRCLSSAFNQRRGHRRSRLPQPPRFLRGDCSFSCGGALSHGVADDRISPSLSVRLGWPVERFRGPTTACRVVAQADQGVADRASRYAPGRVPFRRTGSRRPSITPPATPSGRRDMLRALQPTRFGAGS